MTAEQLQESLVHFVLFAGRNERFSLRKQLRCVLALHTYQLFNQRLVELIHLIVAFRHRSGNNQRRTRVINQDRVDLIDDGIIMAALYEIRRTHRHIITKVIETKFVVCSESNISAVRIAARI